MLQAPGSPGSGPSMPSLRRIDLPFFLVEGWCGYFKRHIAHMPMYSISGWWFGTWILLFHSGGNNHPNWLSWVAYGLGKKKKKIWWSYLLEMILSGSWYKRMIIMIMLGFVLGVYLGFHWWVYMFSCFFCVEMICCLRDEFLWCPNKCHVRLEHRLRSTFKTWWVKLHWLLKQQMMRSNFPSILGSGFSGSMSKTGDW